jgi:hypothetical protein
MQERDQDYDVAEPAVGNGEDSDTLRSRAGRFWRSQPDRVNAADEPDATDDPAVDDQTALNDRAELDNDAALDNQTALDNETALNDETALDNQTALNDETELDDDETALDETGAGRRTDDTQPDDDVVVVAEVIETESVTPVGASAGRADEPFAMPAASSVADDPRDAVGNGTSVQASRADAAESAAAAAEADRDVPAAGASPAFGGQEWREIQATFVDDPHGAVQMAASAADSALNSLVTGLRERQSSLAGAGNQDTEQLRSALQEYRKFCQAISDIGRQLPEPAGTR